MQRRVFVAITLDEGAKKYIEKKIRPFAKQIPAKWVDREKYHITLSFLGYANDDEISEICSSLREELQGVEVFDVLLDRLVWGPDDLRRKMLWLKGPENKNLIKLRSGVEQALSGGSSVAGKFSPHITLVRFRKRELTEAEKVINPSDVDVSVIVPVQSVEVMESIFENGRRTFQTLDSIKFK